MVSDNLINVIAGLVKREGRIAREDAKKAKESLKAEAEKDEEEDDEEPEQEPEVEPEPEPEPKPKKDKEKDKEDDDGYDNKPSGPDPTLVAQIAAIVKQEIKDEEKEKKEKEVKLSGKKEKIDTTPTMKQEGTRMNFREAVRAAVTGSSLAEGYESHVLKILDDEGIVGPLGYDPFFEKGRLFVQKGSESKAKKALKDSDEINKLPKIVGESVEFMLEAGYIKQKPDGMWCVYNDDNEIVKEFESVEEAGRFLETELNDSGNPVGESVDVDGRCRGFKEALRRLTYEKIRQIKEKEKAKKEEVEIEEGEYTSYWMPEGLSKEGAAEFMAAASAAKRDGKKKFKFGDKEYPVTIKVDIPLKKEEVEIDESNELQAVMALDDLGIEAEINKKGEVSVKKKDLKKAEKALKKSFTKGGMPKLVGEGAEVNEESELQKKYKEFYQKMLDKFGVKSPGGLDDAKKKEFFAAIEKGWKEGEGPVKEEVELDESEANDKRNAAINVGIDLRTYLKKHRGETELEKIRDILLKGKLPQVKDMPDDDKSKKVILKLMKNNMKNKFAKRYKGYSSAFDTWITEESELTESTTTDKKNTFTMAPFEDLRSVADAALKIMTRQPQEVKEEEKEEVTKENQPQQLTEQIV
ncbi:hypothetical protein HX837_06130 [Marine Group I thaumarchaeote]|uniref:Uncharacterized protein n=1 Tax=Marine Group I thaumarchaeote TaxID=2511932 RepID=A0A7K4MQA2_9ARCH|nr:hypothetical protein [Marine Group I thaumarchaeote]